MQHGSGAGVVAVRASLDGTDAQQLAADAAVGLVTLGIVAAALTGTYGAVTRRVTETIEKRNMAVRLTRRLQDTQLRLLDDKLTADQAQQLRLEAAKLKVVLKQIEQEADGGQGIRETREKTRRQAREGTELTPLVYLRKSLYSVLKEGNFNSKQSGAGSLRGKAENLVNVLIVVALCLLGGYLLQVPPDNTIPGAPF